MKNTLTIKLYDSLIVKVKGGDVKCFSENLVEFYERLSAWEQAVVSETDLSLAQMHTIEVIGNNGSLRMKDLAQKLGIVMGTLTVMIKRLEQMKLVKREKDNHDKRSFFISLTAIGTKIHAVHHSHHHLLADQLSEHLLGHELDNFNQILEKILKGKF